MPVISEETQQQLKDAAAETMAKFGISYGLYAAWTIYQRAREAAEKKEPDNLKLTYRDFDSVVRTDLFTGYVDVRVGEGPGAMSPWKKVFCVERNDYKIEFYSNQSAYEKKKEPKTTIQPVGYQVVTSNVAEPFRQQIEPVAIGLEVDPKAIEGMVNFPKDSWALFHPQRTKYVFRMCANTGLCCGSKTAKVDVEGSIGRNEWICFLETCVRKHKARDTDTILGMAFEKTCQKIPALVDTLQGWTDDGTEDEMLLEMLITSCLPPVRDDILAQISAQVTMPIEPLRDAFAGRVLMPLWYTAVGLIKKALQSVLAVAWTKITEGATALLDKIEPTLRKGLAPIVTVHNKILDGIKAATNKTLGRMLSEKVTPLIEPMIAAYAKPLTEGFSFARETYTIEVVSKDLPMDAAERKEYLDLIPRRRTTMKTCYWHALTLSEGLDPARRIIDGTLKIINGGGIEANGDGGGVDEDTVRLCSEAEDSLLKALDAAVYTLHLRLESGEQMTEAQKELILTERFDHDVIQLKREVVKTGIRDFVLKYFLMAVFANEELSNIISSLDANIPPELQDFLSVQSVFEGFIEIAVGEPIDRMVEAAKTLK